MKTNVLYITLLGVLLTSCFSGGKPDNFDYGHVETGKYVNSFFKFELTLPDAGWIVKSKEQMNDITAKGSEIIAGDNKMKKVALKAAEINTANLLMAYQYEQGAAVDYNPNISVVAENISASPGVKTGSDYLFHVRKQLQQAQLPIDKIDEKFEKETIGGVEFYKMSVVINYSGLEIHQVYYSTIADRFCLSVIISFIDEEQHQELLKSVHSMKFSN